METNQGPVMETIYKRRSIRAYKTDAVEREKIVEILKAGMAGPSACNLQPWEFIVCDEPESLALIHEASWMKDRIKAPCAIVVCGTTKHLPWGESTLWMQDCGAAIQNMLLAATELGLGSLWTGGLDADKLRASMGLPEYVVPMAIVFIGYADTTRVPISWYDEDAVHWQKFDGGRERKYRNMEMLKADTESGLL